MEQNSHESRTDFFYSDRPKSETELLPSSDIVAMSEQLAQMIHEFNPNYEDKRLTQVQQPLSRRRQIEMELNLSSRQKDPPAAD